MSLHIFLFLESLGTGELLLILMFVLFFFGSKKIPELARGLGKGMREMNDAVRGIREEITSHTAMNEERNMVEGIRKDIQEATQIRESEQSVQRNSSTSKEETNP